MSVCTTGMCEPSPPPPLHRHKNISITLFSSIICSDLLLAEDKKRWSKISFPVCLGSFKDRNIIFALIPNAFYQKKFLYNSQSYYKEIIFFPSRLNTHYCG